MDSSPESFKKTLDKVKTLYGKLSYFDQYGGSVVLFIFITIIVFILVSYCISKSNSQAVIDDWPNQRCKVSVLPYAGYITHPEGTTAFDYTQENFNYCVQEILSSIAKPALEPLTFVTNTMTSLTSAIQSSLQAVRAVFARIRSAIQLVVKNVMSRLINVFTPMQKIILATKDILNKMQGTTTTILYSTLGGYYSLKSLLGAVAQFFIIMLIALSIVIFILSIIPITAWMSVPFIVLFIAISIPISFLLICMKEYLGIEGYVIPNMKCFDKNTKITMNNGSNKIISEIKVGDILCNNNKVTGVIRVATKGSNMYYLNNICVSDTHIVNYKGKWIPVAKHPQAIKCIEYNEPYLYCLNTQNKTIVINDTTFTDWDEIYEKDIDHILFKNPYVKLNSIECIHSKMDSGFVGSTLIKLSNGKSKKIKEIHIGDVLENNEKVYGVVEINGVDVSDQFKFILGENVIEGGENVIEGGENVIEGGENVIEGGPNLVIYKQTGKISTLGVKNKTKLERKHNKLYHLLTDKKTFNIENIQFCDYNAAIDIFLEKNNEKLLSMKYV